MTRRNGKTLVEMLMLMSVLSVIIATVAMTLIALMKTDRQIRRDLDQQTTLARLSDKFRTDAHAAKSCQVGKSCDLTLADGRLILYSVGPRQIAREVRRGETVLHQDSFLLPADAAISFVLPADTGGRLVQLRIDAAPGSDRAYLAPIRPTLIEAAIGLSIAPATKEAQP
jgi:type II secretory pathway component PulJ